MYCVSCGKQMDEGSKFCCSCGAKQEIQDGVQPLNDNAGNSAFTEKAALSSESSQPRPQSPSQQQNSGMLQQEFVLQQQNQMPSQNTTCPQYAAQPQNVVQPQSTMQPQNTEQPQSAMPFQSTARPQNTVQPQNTEQSQSVVKQRDIMKPLSVWQFILVYIILAVPILNIIMLFVWSFGSKANKNKKNLARAYLIFIVVLIVLWVAVGASIIKIFRGQTGLTFNLDDKIKGAAADIVTNAADKDGASGGALGKATSILLDSDFSKWPKDRLHPNMPEYKKGEMNGWNQWDSTKEYSIFILIKDTGKADLDEYISQLKSAGFEEINNNSFRKGIYDVEFQFNSDTILQISSYKADIFEWPKELAGIPPITKGNLTAVTGPSDEYPDGVQLYYINLTEDDLMQWGKDLKAKGFEVDGLVISKNNVDFNGKTYNSLNLQMQENGSDEWIIDFTYSE